MMKQRERRFNNRSREICEQHIVVDELVAQLTLGPFDDEEKLKARLAEERKKLDAMEVRGKYATTPMDGTQ